MCRNLASLSYPFNYYSGLKLAFKTACRFLVRKICSSKVGQLDIYSCSSGYYTVLFKKSDWVRLTLLFILCSSDYYTVLFKKSDWVRLTLLFISCSSGYYTVLFKKSDWVRLTLLVFRDTDMVGK